MFSDIFEANMYLSISLQGNKVLLDGTHRYKAHMELIYYTSTHAHTQIVFRKMQMRISIWCIWCRWYISILASTSRGSSSLKAALTTIASSISTFSHYASWSWVVWGTYKVQVACNWIQWQLNKNTRTHNHTKAYVRKNTYTQSHKYIFF